LAVVALADAAFDRSGGILAGGDAHGEEGVDLFSRPSSFEGHGPDRRSAALAYPR
jgi:hypothetical protein